MKCCFVEICNKDVINIENGSRIGYVADLEIDSCDGRISRLLILRNDKAIHFRRPDYISVCWSDIVVMGDEAILVKNVPPVQQAQKHNFSIFNIFAK